MTATASAGTPLALPIFSSSRMTRAEPGNSRTCSTDLAVPMARSPVLESTPNSRPVSVSGTILALSS